MATTMTATEASRGFSKLLDRVEAGETIRITRGNETIADIRPTPKYTGRALREALKGTVPPDPGFKDRIREGLEAIQGEVKIPWGED
ncbi:MAG: type II toxin-antitoxin system prevent-host-death family antitoxin [Mobiluncus porci]|nr:MULTISPECIES: type II toxin-antitoxin system prevent-host-death family antitoxin [Mobiluncus]MCI6583614.1 type II toxin-antitoxin system prevent-host-death family antitoxin [Mobiluncus sp.]MDD7541225.1 type II toxin-antitoxin system prevent-host-death family antitoxin [Mobiluncus porci]MDY5749315.1 type II toxin-antitoxin system prevent-host-death family antitoxin [Mobiluncus porci]